jgi:AcrR family transcriptional regulator
VTPRIAEDDKAERILQAALELFVEKGFHGTAVPEVAERAHVGAGTIYRYFQDKHALVNALYRKHKESIASLVLKDFPFHEKPREQFRQVWQRMAEFALKHRREFAFLELHHHASYLDEASRALEHQMLVFARSMITEGQKTGGLREMDPDVMIALVNGAFIGLFRAGMEGTAPFSKKAFDEAEERMWQAFGTD